MEYSDSIQFSTDNGKREFFVFSSGKEYMQ